MPVCYSQYCSTVTLPKDPTPKLLMVQLPIRMQSEKVISVFIFELGLYDCDMLSVQSTFQNINRKTKMKSNYISIGLTCDFQLLFFRRTMYDIQYFGMMDILFPLIWPIRCLTIFRYDRHSISNYISIANNTEISTILFLGTIFYFQWYFAISDILCTVSVDLRLTSYIDM